MAGEAIMSKITESESIARLTGNETFVVPNMRPEIKLLRVYFFAYDFDPDRNPPKEEACELPILAWRWSSAPSHPEPLTLECGGPLADVAAEFICHDGKYYQTREIWGRRIASGRPIGARSFTREEAIETALCEPRARYRAQVEKQRLAAMPGPQS
jgi:hypothetical protein